MFSQRPRAPDTRLTSIICVPVEGNGYEIDFDDYLAQAPDYAIPALDKLAEEMEILLTHAPQMLFGAQQKGQLEFAVYEHYGEDPPTLSVDSYYKNNDSIPTFRIRVDAKKYLRMDDTQHGVAHELTHVINTTVPPPQSAGSEKWPNWMSYSNVFALPALLDLSFQSNGIAKPFKDLIIATGYNYGRDYYDELLSRAGEVYVLNREAGYRNKDHPSALLLDFVERIVLLDGRYRGMPEPQGSQYVKAFEEELLEFDLVKHLNDAARSGHGQATGLPANLGDQVRNWMHVLTAHQDAIDNNPAESPIIQEKEQEAAAASLKIEPFAPALEDIMSEYLTSIRRRVSSRVEAIEQGPSR